MRPPWPCPVLKKMWQNELPCILPFRLSNLLLTQSVSFLGEGKRGTRLSPQQSQFVLQDEQWGPGPVSTDRHGFTQGRDWKFYFCNVNDPSCKNICNVWLETRNWLGYWNKTHRLKNYKFCPSFLLDQHLSDPWSWWKAVEGDLNAESELTESGWLQFTSFLFWLYELAELGLIVPNRYVSLLFAGLAKTRFYVCFFNPKGLGIKGFFLDLWSFKLFFSININRDLTEDLYF